MVSSAKPFRLVQRGKGERKGRDHRRAGGGGLTLKCTVTMKKKCTLTGLVLCVEEKIRTHRHE